MGLTFINKTRVGISNPFFIFAVNKQNMVHDLSTQTGRNEYAESKAERKARLDQEIGLLSFTATKSKKYLLIPIGKINFSFKRRKNTLYIGDVKFFHDENMTMDEPTFKEVMKSMKKNKTDILTNGTEFFTRTGEREITRISHPYFYSLLDMDDEIKTKIKHLRFG